MALAFTASVPFPATAARALLRQQQVVGGPAASGGRVLLLGPAPPSSPTLVLVSVPLPPLRCAAGDHISPSDMQKAFLEAMDDARAKCRPIISSGDESLLERLAITAKDSLGLLATMVKDRGFPLPDAMHQVRRMQEVARVTTALVEVQAECDGGYASADTVLSGIDGLRKMSEIFLGVGLALDEPVRPSTTPAVLGDGDVSDAEDDCKINCLLKLADDVSDEEGDYKINHLLKLANKFCLLHSKLQWRYREAASPAAMEEGPVVAYQYQYQAILVQEDKDLLEHLRATAMDCQGLVARMMGKPRVFFPLPDVVCQELIGIGKSFVKLEVECAKGCATTGSVVAAMDGLTRVTEIFAGSGPAKTLKPYDLRSTVAITGDQDKVAFMWDLAAAFGVHFVDVKLRCSDFV